MYGSVFGARTSSFEGQDKHFLYLKKVFVYGSRSTRCFAIPALVPHEHSFVSVEKVEPSEGVCVTPLTTTDGAAHGRQSVLSSVGASSFGHCEQVNFGQMFSELAGVPEPHAVRNSMYPGAQVQESELPYLSI